ncbi:hypothetical protein STEG23_015617 [Scotinomys teguina]
MLLNPERIWFGTVTSLNRTTLLPEGGAEAIVEHNFLISTWLVDTPKLQLLTTLLQMTVSSDLLQADTDQPSQTVIASCICRVREPHASDMPHFSAFDQRFSLWGGPDSAAPMPARSSSRGEYVIPCSLFTQG